MFLEAMKDEVYAYTTSEGYDQYCMLIAEEDTQLGTRYGQKKLQLPMKPGNMAISPNGNMMRKGTNTRWKYLPARLLMQKEITYTVGNSPRQLRREGYVFKGWSLEENAAEPMEETWDDTNGEYLLIAEEDITLYAVWREMVTITFNAGEHGYYTEWQYDDEGNGYEIEVSSKQKNFEKGYYVRSNDCPEPEAREGYVLWGWGLEENATESIENPWDRTLLQAEENVTLYAIWKESVTVTLEAGEHGYYTKWQSDEEGNSYEVEVSFEQNTIAKGEGIHNMMGPQPQEREGYVFLGWSLEENASEPMENNIFEYTDLEGDDHYCMLIAEEDVTLYAVWGEAVTITFNAGEHGYYTEWQYDEDGNQYEEEVFTQQSNYQKGDDVYRWDCPEPEAREGYLFQGWGLEENAAETIGRSME